MSYCLAFLCGFVLLSSTSAYSSELTSSLAKKVGIEIKVTALSDKYNANCSLVEVISPSLLPDSPEFKVLKVGVEVWSSKGKLISATNLSTQRVSHDESYISSGCLPVNERYSVKMMWHYGLEDEEVMRSKSLAIANLWEWMN